MENKMVEAIEKLLEVANELYDGEWTQEHIERMSHVYACIGDLKKITGKEYIISGTTLVYL